MKLKINKSTAYKLIVGIILITLSYFIIQLEWKALTLVVIIFIFLIGIKKMQFLIFITSLILLLNSSSLFAGNIIFNYGRWVPFFMFFGIMIFRIATKKTIRKPKKFDILIIAFIILAFISASYSINPRMTILRSSTLILLYVAVFWVLWGYVDSEEKAKKTVNSILKVAFIVYLAGLVLILFTNLAFRYGRFYGIFDNPNTIGSLAGILFPLALWNLFENKKIFDVILVSIMGISLILSMSRTGLLAVFFGSSYFLYYRLKKYKFIVIIAGLIITILLLFLFSGTTETYLRLDKPSLDEKSAGRLELIKDAIDIIKIRPFLGYGFGTGEYIYLYAGKAKPEHISQSGETSFSSHNAYTDLALTVGIIGMLLFFTPLFILLFKSHVNKRKKNMLHYAFIGVLFSSLIAVFFEGWVFSVGAPETFHFWISVMLLLKLNYLSKKQNK